MVFPSSNKEVFSLASTMKPSNVAPGLETNCTVCVCVCVRACVCVCGGGGGGGALKEDGKSLQSILP